MLIYADDIDVDQVSYTGRWKNPSQKKARLWLKILVIASLFTCMDYRSFFFWERGGGQKKQLRHFLI